MPIDQELIETMLQLGGQYALPAAALLRALYAAKRGKMPEGIAQIFGASALSGVTAAVASDQPPNVAAILGELTGNAVFMAGLLSFVVLYLIRLPIRSMIVDALVGGVLALAAWGIWVYVLGNTELRLGMLPLSLLGAGEDRALVLVGDVATLPIIFIAGAVVMMLLRGALRQVGRLLGLARVLVVLGILAILVAGGLYLYQQVTGGTLQLPGT